MQFSLKSLFLATAGVAVLFALVCTLPDIIALPLMLYVTLILPGATIALIIYGRGYVQAFAIGCGVSPAGPGIFGIPFFVIPSLMATNSNGVDEDFFLVVKLLILGFHLVNISCGLLAVLVRWWIQRSKTSLSKHHEKMPAELAVHDLSTSHEQPYAVIHGRVTIMEVPESIPAVDSLASENSAAHDYSDSRSQQ